VTVGFGSNVEKFKVLDVRRKGSALPPPVADGGSRLVLVTATGLPLMPSGVVYVDADLVGQTQPASTLVITSPIKSEQPGQGDYSTLWALALWLMGLFVALAGAVWSWYRWSRVHTYIVFSPVLLLVGYWVADQVARVLPNLL
jgi:hypothetical protein